MVIGTPSPGDVPVALVDIDQAHDLLDRNRVGIGLDVTKTFVHGRTAPITDTNEACKTVAINGMLAPNSSTIASPDLFVLFVTDIQNASASPPKVYQGLACTPTAGQSGRVIYRPTAEPL